MKIADFDFDLPKRHIAHTPVSPRDSARMLVVHDTLQDSLIHALPGFLRTGDIVVFNNTRVIPARLFGTRGRANIEILLHKRLSAYEWQCFAKPAKRLRPGDIVQFAEAFAAEVVHKTPEGDVILRFSDQEAAFDEQLQRHGHMPLPPYIASVRPADSTDQERYQTVYAKHRGSVAAPTAGLHFTPELLQRLDAMGVEQAHVTLHVGGGTFLPVKTDDTRDHKMHSEWAQITPETVARIQAAKSKGSRVIAVGTTSLRTLESACRATGLLQPFEGDTDIFITPGYRFRCVDMLLTNFHLPKSTLFMLVAAFSGLPRMQQAYRHAIAQDYRFYSYGDACLLYRGE